MRVDDPQGRRVGPLQKVHRIRPHAKDRKTSGRFNCHANSSVTRRPALARGLKQRSSNHAVHLPKPFHTAPYHCSSTFRVERQYRSLCRRARRSSANSERADADHLAGSQDEAFAHFEIERPPGHRQVRRPGRTRVCVPYGSRWQAADSPFSSACFHGGLQKRAIHRGIPRDVDLSIRGALPRRVAHSPRCRRVGRVVPLVPFERCVCRRLVTWADPG